MTVPVLERETLRWTVSLGIVLLAHAALVATAWWPSSSAVAPSVSPAQAVMVELAPTRSAPPAPRTELPPGSPQQEQRQAKSRAEPALDPQHTPRQEQAEFPESQLPLEQQVDTGARITSTHTSAAPSVQAPPDDRYAARQSLVGIADQAMISWQAQLLGHLEHYKRYPRPAQRRRQEGIAQVQFSVDRQGRVSHIRIAQSSGHEPLDAETLATVQRANPLPPPPPEVKGNPVEVIVPVDFFIRRR